VRSTVVIVGAGVTGLVTAIECALAGHRVTVLDRGPIPNPESTSFDQHRAMRVPIARRRWLELETLLDTRFFRRVGVVTAWPRADLASVTGASMEIIEPEKLPHVVFPPGSVGVLDTDAGVLLAERFLRSAARWLARHPAVTLRPDCAVTAADVHDLGADLVLIAAGPWSRDLVEVPVVLHRQTMVYLRPPENLVAWWENAPGVGRLGPDGRAWLLPPGDGTLLKLSTDAACREVDTMDSVDDRPWAARVLAESMLSNLDSYTVVAVRDCHYTTDAATGGALLTRVGPGVWSRAACGGSGFSRAPLVASQIISELEAAA
jgi:glycine/D-amino acid oxidase-like deaminating enzyme